MKTCKHPVENIFIKTKHDSSPDGYGGTSEWTWEELTCSKCNEFITLDARVYIQRTYEKLTGRELLIGEFQKLFLKNEDLYNKMNISNGWHDIVQRTVGKRTDDLEQKILKKQKLLAKHKAELAAMLSDFHGRSIGTWEVDGIMRYR